MGTEQWKKVAWTDEWHVHIMWMAGCLCVTYLGNTWHQNAVWEEVKAEAVWCDRQHYARKPRVQWDWLDSWMSDENFPYRSVLLWQRKGDQDSIREVVIILRLISVHAVTWKHFKMGNWWLDKCLLFQSLYSSTLQVYITCSVILCEPESPFSRCAQGCLKDPSRRRRRGLSGETGRHYITQGPLQFVGQPFPDTAENSQDVLMERSGTLPEG